jgi:hypothetical protein
MYLKKDAAPGLVANLQASIDAATKNGKYSSALVLQHKLTRLERQIGKGTPLLHTMLVVRKLKRYTKDDVSGNCYYWHTYQPDRQVVVPIQSVVGKFAPHIFKHACDSYFQGNLVQPRQTSLVRLCPIPLRLL